MKKHFTSLFLILILSFPVIVSGQGDGNDIDQNPNLDQVPLQLRENYEPEFVTATVITVDGYDNFKLGVNFAEPHMSTNPVSPAEYFNGWNINATHRTYNGYDWIYSIPSFGSSVAGDPVTAYDSDGNLYYMSMYGSISGAKVIKSTDGGATWSSAVIAISGGDKCWMAADQTDGPYSNYIYATMTNTSFSGHNFSRSTNGGVSFQTTYAASGSSLPGAMVAVGPDILNGDIDGGAVYFVTNTGPSYASTYRFYVSNDGGATFTFKSSQDFAGYVGSFVSGRNSVQNMRTRPYPFIAADNSNGTYRGRLYLVYATNNPAGNNNKPDIYCRYSDDQGSTWSGPVTVNDDLNSQNNHQWHPSIWCDTQTGRLYVKWMDTRDTPTSDSAYIYASYSDDGGQTFATNQRISNQKMKINCTTCGSGGSPRYQGDYDAITSTGNVGMAVWTDFREGQFGSFTGYFPDFAMLAYPMAQTVGNTNDSTTYIIEIPSTTLYEEDAVFSADIVPPPSSGMIDLSFEPSNIISTFPGSITLKVKTMNVVNNGVYTINIEGKGPNEIPVHRREVELTVQDVIPVELISFDANISPDNVTLIWSTSTETNNSGFEIERMFSEDGQKGSWNKIGFVEGNGNSTSQINYSFVDEKVTLTGKYNYRLKQIDYDGTFEYSNTIEIEIEKPLSFELHQNYPNPFNPSTTISYTVPEKRNVKIKVLDILGNEITELVNEVKEPGNYTVEFKGTELASGIYFYSMYAGDFVLVKKFMLLK